MEVILMERVEKLGQMGDVVNVKGGFARNFLLPQKKAMRATKENRAQFEVRRAQLEAVNLESRTEAEDIGKRLEGLTVILIRQAGDAGQLYGSANSRNISDAVVEAGFTISRSQVRLDTPIKTIGVHAIRIDLHPEVSVSISVNVARTEGEAEIQAKTGQAVMSTDDDDRNEAAPVATEFMDDEGAAALAAEETAAEETTGEDTAIEEEKSE